MAPLLTATTTDPPVATGLWQRRAAVAVAVALALYLIAFLAFAVLTQRGLVADGAAYFVVVLATLLLHEAMCMFGPILAVIAWRRAGGESRTPIRWLWHLVALWLIAAAALALYFTVVPINRLDRTGFIEGLTRLHFIRNEYGHWNPPVAIALVAALLMVLCCRAEGWMRRFLPIWL